MRTESIDSPDIFFANFQDIFPVITRQECAIARVESNDSTISRIGFFSVFRETGNPFPSLVYQLGEDAVEAKATVSEWLTSKGLELSDEKTSIRNLTDGFDFLGWNFRKYNTTKRKTGFITLVKPSKGNIQAFKDGLKDLFKALKGSPVGMVVKELNLKIRGWGGYHDGVVAQESFSSVDNYIYWKLMRWAKRSHPQKSSRWIASKYYGRLCPGRKDNWVFGDKSCEHTYVQKLAWIPIQRHTLVQYTNSPDDLALAEYWEERNAKQRKRTATDRFSKGQDKIARRQDYRCPVCKQPLMECRIHLHHIQPIHLGGKDTYDNLIYLHEDCHHSIHALGATNPKIQQMLRNGRTKPYKTRKQKPKGTKSVKSNERGSKNKRESRNWLSRVQGDLLARFLGGEAGAIPPTYPII